MAQKVSHYPELSLNRIKIARRPNIDTLARRQTFGLGRHRGEHTGSLYLSSSVQFAGLAADLAATRKEAKYTSLTNSYIFQPIAVESHGSFSASSLSFLTTLGERLTGTSGDLRELISIPKTLGHCTVFQFSLNTRELCFTVPQRLNDIFTFCSCNDMLAMLSRGQ